MRFFLTALLMAVCRFSALAGDDYYPLHVGQLTTFDATEKDFPGNFHKGFYHVKVETTVEHDGKTYFQIQRWTEGIPTQIHSTALTRKDDKGAYHVSGYWEETEVVLPLKPGMSWPPITMENRVIGLETLEIGGKTFKNCFHIRFTQSAGFSQDSWLAPNIGLVQWNILTRNGDKLTFTLKEFKAGK